MKKLSLLLVLAMTASIASASVINVPATYPTVQQGINAALEGDTVLVEPGMYVENVSFIGRNITLASQFLMTGDTSYISQTVLDGGAAERVIIINSGETTDSRIIGFTIQNGFSPFWEGPGIYCVDAGVSVHHNCIKDNVGGSGGGIRVGNSVADIQYNYIHNNSVDDYGGGIAVDADASAFIFRNQIIGNTAGWYGGGIWVSHSYASVVENEIIDNTAQKGGGYFGYDRPSGDITSNVIADNTATLWGGGIYIGDYVSPSVHHNLIARNRAENGVNGCGGGIFLRVRAHADIVGCTIVDNVADSGGGLYCQNADPSLSACILAFNTGEAYIGDSQSDPTFYCSDIIGNSGGDWTGSIAGQLGVDGNISLDPAFCDMMDGDYQLHYLSPCAPNNNGCGAMTLIGALPVACYDAKLLVDPDTMYRYDANRIIPITATVYLGEVRNGSPVSDLDLGTLRINDSLLPVCTVIPSHPEFDGEVIEMVLPMRDLILSYGPWWNSEMKVLTCDGFSERRSPLHVIGEFLGVGHISGDLNGDGAIDITDIIAMVDYQFLGGSTPPIMAAADVDGNCAIDISDLVYLVDYMFSGGPPPVACP